MAAKSGYVRVTVPDTVVLQVGINSGSVVGSPVYMTNRVTSWRVSGEGDIDTVIYAANRNAERQNIELKVQDSDGQNLFDTTVEVPGYGAVQIPMSQFATKPEAE